MSVMDRLARDLAEGRPILLDGATGTELERRGASMHDAAWCAMATLTSTNILRGIHEDYIRAGARVVTANTFSTNRLMLGPAGLADRFEALNRTAVATAREARDAAGGAARVAVAGSMSHQIPVAPGTDRRSGAGVPDPPTARAHFREMAGLLADAGVDLILMEMMSDPDLANPAIESALATGLPVWVGFSARADGDGRPVSYARPDLPFEEMLAAIDFQGAGVAGVMHSNVLVTGAALDALRTRWNGPLMAYPDSGHFTMPHWHFENVIPPHEFARIARGWVDAGVTVVGGCCGLGLEHIESLAAAVNFA